MNLALLGVIGNLYGLAADFAILNVALRAINAGIKDHGDLFEAVGACKKLFHFIHTPIVALLSRGGQSYALRLSPQTLSKPTKLHRFVIPQVPSFKRRDG